MKQVEYSKEQQQIIEILKPLKELLLNSDSWLKKADIKKVITQIEDTYNIKPLLLTLREYLEKHSIGAYHNFIFKINYIIIKL